MPPNTFKGKPKRITDTGADYLSKSANAGGSPPPAPFDPLTLPNEFFFRGDSITGSSASVTTLVDLSTNSRNASLVGGTNWTQVTSDTGINNQTSLQLNSSGYYRYAADATNLIGTVNQSFYMYGVYRVPSTLAKPAWWLATGWTSDSFVATFANASPTYARLNFGRAASAGTAAIGDIAITPAFDAWVTMIVEYNGTAGTPATASNWTITLNGVVATPAALAGLGIAKVRNWIGARPNAASPVGGRLAEVGLAKGTLSAGDKTGLASYWLTRYAL